MIYQPGDKLILRSDLFTYGWIEASAKAYHDLNPKVVTVKAIIREDTGDYYQFEEIGQLWKENEVLKPFKIHEPIDTRFEILDL